MFQDLHAEDGIEPPSFWKRLQDVDVDEAKALSRPEPFLAVGYCRGVDLCADGEFRGTRAIGQERQEGPVPTAKVQDQPAPEATGKALGELVTAPVAPRDEASRAADLLASIMPARDVIPDLHAAPKGGTRRR
jgi:hypothetical protein